MILSKIIVVLDCQEEVFQIAMMGVENLGEFFQMGGGGREWANFLLVRQGSHYPHPPQ